jgi:basic membrane lipoprotein Med (substrate-binding protein (PBP1-ABC) superfamily)
MSRRINIVQAQGHSVALSLGRRIHARRLWSFTLALLLAACAAPTRTPSPTGTAPTPTRAPAVETPEPTPTLAPPTPTLVAARIAYVTEAADNDALAARLADFAAANGWELEIGNAASVRELLQESPRAVVSVSAALSADEWNALALENPQVYMILLGNGSPAGALPPNVSTLGGPGSRQDQAAFLAGAVAGYATETQRVAVVSDLVSPEGMKYRNGFYHGVLYACPRCRVDFVDLVNTSDTATATAEVTQLVILGSDVVFAAPGEAGEAALVTAAQRGARVIGSSGDVYVSVFGGGATPGADHALTSAYLDAGAAIYAALVAFHAGTPLAGAQPLSAASGALVLAPYRDPESLLALPELAVLAEAQSRLADGSLETGIDPATGEVR